MKLYNSLTRNIEEFEPRDKNLVKIYTCGPTVYSFAHIGNLRSYIMEDILVKTLEYNNYKTLRVMNITDVGHLTDDGDNGEDKMLKGAIRENKTIKEIAQFYCDAFMEDMERLHLKTPDVLESATSCIDEFIKVIEALIEKGYAYFAGGNVYFDTSKLDKYHVFYNFKAEDLDVGVREGVDIDASKRNPNDFVLWFTKSKFENQALRWESPWGVGYPGWHIECSCIAMKNLGDYVDIHCGGIDNAFPHHTNEIAQSEAFLGKSWCKHWMHVLHLQGKNGKMSKSKGETFTLNGLIEKAYSPEVYKLFCLQSHYRKPLVFTYENLDNTLQAYNKLISKIKNIKRDGEIDNDKFNSYREKFKEGISDDLNTALALSVLYEVFKDTELNGNTKIAIINDFDKVFGLNLVGEEINDEQESKLSDDILELINQRQVAKQNKDYATADKIRNQLKEQGINLIDTANGTTYERI